MAKFKRKLCNFDKDKQCIRFIDGERACVLGENDDYRGSVRKIVEIKLGTLPIHFCSLVPKSKMVEYMNDILSGKLEVVVCEQPDFL